MSNIHKQLFQAWNDRDFDAYSALLHPEYSYTGGDGKEMTGGPSTGVAIAKLYASAFPDSAITVTNVYQSAGVSVCEFVARGTHGGDLMGIPASGRRVEIHVCNVIELRDGKAWREREYMDMATMMAQISGTSAA